MTVIKIVSENKVIEITFKFTKNQAADVIKRRLPVTSKVQIWGDEIYFDTGIEAPSEGVTLDVNVGDIAYWPQGQCLCLFFGKTPASTTEKPVPASGVIIIGKAEVDHDVLRKISSGSTIIIE